MKFIYFVLFLFTFLIGFSQPIPFIYTIDSIYENHLYGYFDKNTNQIIGNPNYTYASKFYLNKFAFVRKYNVKEKSTSYIGVIDNEGKTILPFKYDRIEKHNNTSIDNGEINSFEFVHYNNNKIKNEIIIDIDKINISKIIDIEKSGNKVHYFDSLTMQFEESIFVYNGYKFDFKSQYEILDVDYKRYYVIVKDIKKNKFGILRWNKSEIVPIIFDGLISYNNLPYKVYQFYNFSDSLMSIYNKLNENEKIENDMKISYGIPSKVNYYENASISVYDFDGVKLGEAFGSLKPNYVSFNNSDSMFLCYSPMKSNIRKNCICIKNQVEKPSVNIEMENKRTKAYDSLLLSITKMTKSPFLFNYITKLHNFNYCMIVKDLSDQYILLDSNGKELLTGKYLDIIVDNKSRNIVAKKLDNKYLIFNYLGNRINELEFDSIVNLTFNFKECKMTNSDSFQTYGYFVLKDGMSGIIGLDGKFILNLNNTEIDSKFNILNWVKIILNKDSGIVMYQNLVTKKVLNRFNDCFFCKYGLLLKSDLYIKQFELLKNQTTRIERYLVYSLNGDKLLDKLINIRNEYNNFIELYDSSNLSYFFNKFGEKIFVAQDVKCIENYQTENLDCISKDSVKVFDKFGNKLFELRK